MALEVTLCNGCISCRVGSELVNKRNEMKNLKILLHVSVYIHRF